MQNDLKFSGINPVVINYNGSADDLYAPIKTSSCDVNIVSNQILDDLYTAKKDEIFMKVGKKIPVKEMVVKYSDQGSVISVQTGGMTQSYTIFSKDLFYTDVNGDFRFNGKIEDVYGTVEEVNLKYDQTNGIWERNNDWLLNWGDQYFYVGTTSYRVIYNGSVHWISSWAGNFWGTPSPYYKVDSGVSSDCAYWCDNIVHYGGNGVELVWGKNRYTWDSTNMRWVSATAYHPEQGGDYFAIYGENALKVKVGLVTLDALIVNSLSGSSQAEIASSWIIIPDRTTGEFTCYIPLTVQYGSESEVFTDDQGYVYYVTTDGHIYTWCPEISKWVDWVTLEGDIKPNTVHLDYVIKGTHKKIVIKYQNTSNEDQFFMLSNFSHPKVYEEEEIVPGEFTTETIWEGYKMPNTYSQDVTQNLDTISMTAIDPVSILKYVKIDKILNKPQIMTYGQLIGLALAYVKLDSNTLKVERNVTYGSSTYDGYNGLLDLKCQVSNFWDEAGEPSSLYEMIEELLRPFCLTLEYVNDCYQIYNISRTEGQSTFDIYLISDTGSLTSGSTETIENEVYNHDDNDWISNNISNAAIEIGSTYDKVTGTSSTSIPEFSKMVFDVVDYNQTQKYDTFDCNVQKNKTKGYRRLSPTNVRLDTADAWYYIWNGVYTDELYQLESHGGYVNGYLNINKANTYLNGETGHPDDYGSILNFYGGAENPTGTGKEQDPEKPVEVHKRITAYAADNGTPLEFLELSDLAWSWSRGYDPEAGWSTPELAKTSPSSAKFGESKAMQSSNKVSYHQEYDMNLSSLEEHTVSLSLTQSYSRTGIDSNIDIYQNNTATNKGFNLTWDDDEQKWRAELYSAAVSYFPGLWDAAAVKVDGVYFNRYRTASTMFRPSRVQPVWDKRRVMMYIELSDNSVLQFNGKEWVTDLHPETGNSFYLMKMMNGEKLYHTDFKYNLIETSDGDHYSLTNERYTYYVDEVGGVVDHSVSGGTTYYCDVYKAEGNEWYQWIDACGEGQLKIKMPPIDDINAKVCVDIYNSTMLGMTGQSNTSGYNFSEAIYALVEGTGRYWDDDQQEYIYITLSSNNCVNYGALANFLTYILFIPVNTSYVKAEHLDLDISVTVPESNLGQMFSQSDIKYTIDKKSNYAEEFQGPTFRTNTYNQLVASSYSYIIFDSAVADPGGFVINQIAVRPECYTVQAYMNWLSEIRKIYDKTLVPLKDVSRPFNNFKTFLTSPEVGENKLLVVSDSWDIKTNRHSIKAIEAQDLDVYYVNSFAVIEVPRMARAERWNLPTAYKQ